MKEGWTYRDFVECLKKVPKQKAVKSKDYLETGLYPVVSQESCLVSGYSNDKDLLYSHERPVAIFGDHTKNVKYVDFDFVVGADGVHILDIKEDILPKFFYYELCSIKLRDLGYARHYKLLKEKRIKFPSLPEQERIVSYLNAQFAKIDALKANTEQQLQAAKDLFQSALKEMLTPKEGWESKKLSELCSVCGEYGLNEASTIFNGVRYLRITDITDSGELNDDKVSAAHNSDKKQSKLIEGDILFARTGATVGKTLVYKEEFGDCEFAGYLIRYRTNPKVILPKYLFYITHSNEYYNWVSENQAAAAQPNISAQKYNNLVINYPFSLKEQRDIVAILDTLSDKVARLQANYNQTLTLCNDLKQSLLKSIFA